MKQISMTVWAFVVGLVALPPQGPPVEPSLPENAERYEPTRVTQKIYTMNGFTEHYIDKVPTTGIDPRWEQSGGMHGIEGVESVKYRTLPAAARYWVAETEMWNGSNHQDNRAIRREYLPGTQFDDVLRYRGRIFEHRVRRKLPSGKWSSKVVYSDSRARPPGYNGLQQTCASCHDRAGMANREEGRTASNYDKGLPPGGDTVFSDPLDWSVVGK